MANNYLLVRGWESIEAFLLSVRVRVRIRVDIFLVSGFDVFLVGNENQNIDLVDTNFSADCIGQLSLA